MAQTFQVYDTESGRVISTIKRVAAGVKLEAAALVSTNASVTVTSTAGLWPGMLLIGKGITTGTTVASIDTATTFTMSAVATASGTGLYIIAVSYIPYKADGTIETRDVHLEHYRDLFSDSSAVMAGISPNEISGSLTSPGAVTYIDNPVLQAAGTFGGGFLISNAIVSGTATLTLSDDKAHLAPRAQIETCSFVHFVLDDGALLPVLRRPSYNIVPVI